MSKIVRHITGLLVAGGLVAFASLPAVARTDGGSAPEVKQVSAAPSQMGVNSPFAEKVQVGGRSVQLNGAGTRYKAVFQVYRAALYTEKQVIELPHRSGVVQRDIHWANSRFAFLRVNDGSRAQLISNPIFRE